MPLDEREQRILDEIERQFREEDPELVEAVNTMPLARFAKGGIKLSIAGMVVGLLLILATFSINPFPALIGFVIMVYSVTRLVSALGNSSRADAVGGADKNLGSRFRSLWRFGR